MADPYIVIDSPGKEWHNKPEPGVFPGFGGTQRYDWLKEGTDKMKTPEIAESVFVAPDAVILGDVHIGEDCSIWFHTVIRAEDASVRIGEGTNIQDNSVVHVDKGHPVTIGNQVTVGHGAIIHGCRIGDNTLIGMGAILLNGAVIGKNCIIGAGALVTQNTIVPDNSMVIGSPASVKRQVLEREVESNCRNAEIYIKEGKDYADFFRKKQ